MIFERPPLETIPPAKERWTPLFLEHGKVEVDDSSVKWIGADGDIFRIPVATLSALLLGPGTTITHEAIKACVECDTPVCWVGHHSMHFYAIGKSTSYSNENARLQALLYSDLKTRNKIARKMFLLRFQDVNVDKYTVNELRGFEGRRVKQLYESMGRQFGVSWKGRNYDKTNWDVADNINKSISIANAALYSLTLSVVTSMGYLPQLGFIHSAGTLPFVYDIADIYKPITTLPAAFEVCSNCSDITDELVISRFKHYVEKEKVLIKMPIDITNILSK